jgi:hypothetical protein
MHHLSLEESKLRKEREDLIGGDLAAAIVVEGTVAEES